MKRSLLAALIVIGAGYGASAAENAGRAISVSVEHVPLKSSDPADMRAGKLIFRDGVVLRSDEPTFGGISSLAISADGVRFLAITDEGSWLTGRIAYDGNGRIAALDDVCIAPMLGEDGKPLDGKAEADAESLAIISGETDDGIVAVGFERDPRIWGYRLGETGFASKPLPAPTPDDLKAAPNNGGLEALASLDARHLLLLTEDYLDEAGNSAGWISQPANMQDVQYDQFALKRIPPFAPTDARLMPDGDILVLERSYTPIGGPGMQLRRIARADLKAGATVDAETLAQLGAGYSIDNMEGLAVRAGEDGETLIYVISDDNFNPLQRTILLLFALEP